MKTSKWVLEAQKKREAILAKMAKLKFVCDEEEFHNFDEPDSEEYTVAFIRKYLLTEEQRKWLFDQNYSVEDLLNGRTNQQHETFVHQMFADWNDKCGQHYFGF